jgi:hypothetical protein
MTPTEIRESNQRELARFREESAALVEGSHESLPMRGVAAVATGSEEPRPAAAYPDEELVELYQQICARVGAYNTEILIERMFELRAELLKRLAARPNIDSAT